METLEGEGLGILVAGILYHIDLHDLLALDCGDAEEAQGSAVNALCWVQIDIVLFSSVGIRNGEVVANAIEGEGHLCPAVGILRSSASVVGSTARVAVLELGPVGFLARGPAVEAAGREKVPTASVWEAGIWSPARR